ncbi:MAG: mercury methylation ferredoxin HgcB [Chloroflexota bacterium]
MVGANTLNMLRYDAGLCTGCETCCSVCPHGVFAMQSGKAQPANPEACMECGACALNCPTGAIQVDSGVGCASAMIRAVLRGRKTQPRCGPRTDGAQEGACCGR